MAPSKALEGGSERRGKVCCFVMHGSRSHVAEMMHDVFPPPLAAHGAGAEPACSMPTFPSPANIWKHLGRCSISVAAGDMWKVLEAPPPPPNLNKAAPAQSIPEAGGHAGSARCLAGEGVGVTGHPSTGIPAHGEGGRQKEEVVCIPSVQICSSHIPVPSSQVWPGLSIHP